MCRQLLVSSESDSICDDVPIEFIVHALVKDGPTVVFIGITQANLRHVLNASAPKGAALVEVDVMDRFLKDVMGIPVQAFFVAM